MKSKVKQLEMQKLDSQKMEVIVGGCCWAMGAGCGIGLALSFFTGGFGAIMFGPATAGWCAGYAIKCL